MAGEMDHGQVAPGSPRAMAVAHGGQPPQDAGAGRVLVAQALRLHLGVEAGLRVEQRRRHVGGIGRGKVELQVRGRLAVVADAHGQHVEPGAGGHGGPGAPLDGGAHLGQDPPGRWRGGCPASGARGGWPRAGRFRESPRPGWPRPGRPSPGSRASATPRGRRGWRRRCPRASRPPSCGGRPAGTGRGPRARRPGGASGASRRQRRRPPGGRRP